MKDKPKQGEREGNLWVDFSDSFKSKYNKYTPVVLVDIDDTICYNPTGQPYQIGVVKESAEIPIMIGLLLDLHKRYHLVFLTGRDYHQHEDTYNYLKKIFGHNTSLITRYNHGMKVVDYKEEAVEFLIWNNKHIAMAFDDSQEIIDMYNRKGIMTAKITHNLN